VLEVFSFTWGQLQETDSYPAVQTFVSKCLTGNLRCAVVGNGEHLGLTGGLLFEQTIWSLRSATGVHGEDLYLRGSVRGRTDLIVYDDRGQKLRQKDAVGRNQVRMAIEVKLLSAMATPAGLAGCQREAICQLIGLNVDNAECAPPVILTNLAKTHKVFYICRISDSPLLFCICVQHFTSLSKALMVALSLGTRRGEVANFSRPPGGWMRVKRR
jgi:hypothetical protein